MREEEEEEEEAEKEEVGGEGAEAETEVEVVGEGRMEENEGKWRDMWYVLFRGLDMINLVLGSMVEMA